MCGDAAGLWGLHEPVMSDNGVIWTEEDQDDIDKCARLQILILFGTGFDVFTIQWTNAYIPKKLLILHNIFCL
jgi:hypothetical protein